MANLLNSISSFITRHMEGAPARDAQQATRASDRDGPLNPPIDAVALPSPPPAPCDAADAERDACEAQLPLVPLPIRHESFAAPKLRPSRTLGLHRASTSVTVPSRAVVTTRTGPARAHELQPPALTLTETERVRLQVMQVQIRLQSIALYEGPIDGTMNPETVTGVRHFQTLKGLRPTGTLAVGTLHALGVRLID